MNNEERDRILKEEEEYDKTYQTGSNSWWTWLVILFLVVVLWRCGHGG